MPPDAPVLNFLNGLDYVVLGIYILIVVGVGIYVSRYNQATDDYFKGGGHVPWGLSGVSLFISGFSAFMFVGASGVAYRDGFGALALFSLAGPAYLLGYLIYGPLWRRTRIDTPMQFLSRRYSPGTTYVYTLLSVFPNVLILGIWIYMLCILVSSAFGFGDATFAVLGAELTGFQLSLLLTGSVMVLYTMIGGLWAVLVTDTLQFVILLMVTLVMVPLAYAYLGDGSIIEGAGRMLREAPDGFFDLKLTGQQPVFWVAYFISIAMGYNVNWHIAQRYYSVPDERDTRKMALWCAGLGVLLPCLWLLPVLVTPVLFPDIEAMWPGLAKPAEASFVTLAMTVLPNGMLGVMVAAIFAATMSSADTTFNWLAAVLTKDVYVPATERLRGRTPSERTQLLVGKASVGVMGVLAIWVAFNMDRFGGAFDVYLRADSLYKTPMFVPVMLGLVFTRTPWWSAIVAMVAGIVGVLATGAFVNIAQGQPVTPAALFMDIRLTVLGMEMGRYEVNMIVGAIVSTVVFFASAAFARRTGAFKERIEAFERDLRTPAYAEPGAALDLRGLDAFQLAGRITFGIGLGLLGLGLATLSDGGAITVAAALLALLIGVGIVLGVQRYERRLRSLEPTPPAAP